MHHSCEWFHTFQRYVYIRYISLIVPFPIRSVNRYTITTALIRSNKWNGQSLASNKWQGAKSGGEFHYTDSCSHCFHLDRRVRIHPLGPSGGNMDTVDFPLVDEWRNTSENITTQRSKSGSIIGFLWSQQKTKFPKFEWNLIEHSFIRSKLFRLVNSFKLHIVYFYYYAL